jgi:hypothetical protein
MEPKEVTFLSTRMSPEKWAQITSPKFLSRLIETNKSSTLPIFSMTTALVEKLAHYRVLVTGKNWQSCLQTRK